MKSAIITTLLIVLFSLSCFSQEESNTTNDSTTRALPINPQEYHLQHPDLSTLLEKNKLPYPDIWLRIPELQRKRDNDFIPNFERIEREHNIDNMPCVIPRFESRMPVYRPDTTTNYTMMQKKIK
jgi:hypothetical protein